MTSTYNEARMLKNEFVAVRPNPAIRPRINANVIDTMVIWNVVTSPSPIKTMISR